MKFKRKILTFGGGIQTRSLGNELNRRQIPHCPSDRGIRAVIAKLWQHLRSEHPAQDTVRGAQSAMRRHKRPL